MKSEKLGNASIFRHFLIYPAVKPKGTCMILAGRDGYFGDSGKFLIFPDEFF